MPSNLSSLKASLSLKNRSILEIKGEGIKDFLQGLVTNDLSTLKTDQAIYALFLTSKGRYDLDCFIYELPDSTVLLDVPAECASTLLKRLNMYKLRRPLTIMQNTELGVFVGPNPYKEGAHSSWVDPRFEGLGYRWVAGNQGQEKWGDKTYHSFLIDQGIPSYGYELISDKTIPLEANLDYLNAISFEKGCYVGQELTSRTHFQGEIRKRYLPFKLEDGQQLKDDCLTHDVTFKGEAIGKLTSFCDHGGMGKFLVSAFKESLANASPLYLGDVKLYPFIPAYLESALEF